MQTRLSIGDFSRMTYLSVKALRHYHEQGVLEPAEVDPVTGYRFYSPSQVCPAQMVRRLRDLGMPLDDVREVLRAPDPDARAATLVAHLRRMEQQLAETQQTVASLRTLLSESPAPLAVERRESPATGALAVVEHVRGTTPWPGGWPRSPTCSGSPEERVPGPTPRCSPGRSSRTRRAR